jgi:hypothetical protein
MLKKAGASSAVAAMVVAMATLAPYGADAKDRAQTRNRADKRVCKTLVGEMVAFGEQSTRDGANNVLDREIKTWETRYNVKAEPQDRKMACKDYIKLLNEFECKVTATVCRDLARPGTSNTTGGGN